MARKSIQSSQNLPQRFQFQPKYQESIKNGLFTNLPHPCHSFGPNILRHWSCSRVSNIPEGTPSWIFDGSTTNGVSY